MAERNIIGKIEESKFEKFMKIPVEIEAYQTDEEVYIETLEGVMKADKGDWIIKGVKGELYPCKPDVFKNRSKERVNEFEEYRKELLEHKEME